MKITCSKKDDILRQKAEYDAQKAKYDEAYGIAKEKWTEVHKGIKAPIREYVESVLSKFNLLEFEVYVEVRYTDTMEVRIRCNDNNKFSDDSALSWNYDIYLDKDGEVHRETGSWSGLKAVTQAQIDSLKQSVEAIETLYNVDWKQLLDVELPEYKDYFTQELYDQEPKRPDRPWEAQLAEAELSDAVGSNTWFKCRIRDTDNRHWYDYWINPIKETPMRFTVQCIHARSGETEEDLIQRMNSGDMGYKWVQTVSKVNLGLSNPIRKVEI